MTFERDAADATLRELARTQLRLLTTTIAQLVVSLDLDKRLELSAAVTKLRRLLDGDEARTPPPPNVTPLRRDLGTRVRPARSYSQSAGEPLHPDEPPKGAA